MSEITCTQLHSELFRHRHSTRQSHGLFALAKHLLIFDIRQSARMSKIKNGGLDQYGAEPFEQQQFGLAGVQGVKSQLLSTVAAILSLIQPSLTLE